MQLPNCHREGEVSQPRPRIEHLDNVITRSRQPSRPVVDRPIGASHIFGAGVEHSDVGVDTLCRQIYVHGLASQGAQHIALGLNRRRVTRNRGRGSASSKLDPFWRAHCHRLDFNIKLVADRAVRR